MKIIGEGIDIGDLLNPADFSTARFAKNVFGQMINALEKNEPVEYEFRYAGGCKKYKLVKTGETVAWKENQ